MEKQLVVFDLAGEQYGIDIAAVESIIKAQAITSVPQSEDFILGITNLRGKILPVVDLRKKLGLDCRPVDRNSRIVVINVNTMEVGMLVDAVSEVLGLQEEDIEPTPALVASRTLEFIDGIARICVSEGQQRLVILLNLQKVFYQEEETALSLVANPV